MSQYLIQTQALDEKAGTAEIRGEEAHHAKRAARLKPGEPVRLFDGAGRRWAGRVLAVTPATVEVTDMTPLPANELPFALKLVAAPPKGDRWEWLLEKAVELGVTEIIPVVSEHSVTKPETGRIARQVERWAKIAAAAAKQSERGLIPVVRAPLALADFLKNLPPPAANEKRYLCAERSGLNPPIPPHPGESAMAAVGPEGGFTVEEADLFIKAGFTPVGLGPRILRSETAALAALNLIALGR